MPFQLTAATTALVLIDLQNGIVGMQLQPHLATSVLEHPRGLAADLRHKGGTVVYVTFSSTK